MSCMSGSPNLNNLTDKMKRSFFQAAVTSILLYGCTTWTLTKRLEKKLDGNYTRMLRAILNKSWQQHPTRHQLYGHLPPITKTIQVLLIYSPLLGLYSTIWKYPSLHVVLQSSHVASFYITIFILVHCILSSYPVVLISSLLR